jgi:hypothetical protein
MGAALAAQHKSCSMSPPCMRHDVVSGTAWPGRGPSLTPLRRPERWGESTDHPSPRTEPVNVPRAAVVCVGPEVVVLPVVVAVFADVVDLPSPSKS